MKKKTLRKLRRLRTKVNDKSIRITAEGQECRHCDGKVIRKEHKPEFKPRPNQPYYFRYWFKCVKCKALYMVEAAKVYTRGAGIAELDQAFTRALEKES